jgi:hypothetical protein
VTTELPTGVVDSGDVDYPVVGTTLVLTCKYQDTATFTATKWKWYKDGDEMIGDVSKTLDINTDISGNEGKYQCIAIDAREIAELASAKTPEKDVQFHTVTTELDAAVEYPVSGTAYQLTCKYEGAAIATPISYEWYKGVVKVENQVSQTYDATDDGAYHCIAVDKDSKKSAATPAKTLKFHTVTTELPAGEVLGVYGSGLELTCKTSDDIIFTQFAFYKDGIEVRALGDSKTYTITGPTSSNDKGAYHCIATDDSNKKSAPTPVKDIDFHSVPLGAVACTQTSYAPTFTYTPATGLKYNSISKTDVQISLGTGSTTKCKTTQIKTRGTTASIAGLGTVNFDQCGGALAVSSDENHIEYKIDATIKVSETVRSVIRESFFKASVECSIDRTVNAVTGA